MISYSTKCCAFGSQPLGAELGFLRSLFNGTPVHVPLTRITVAQFFLLQTDQSIPSWRFLLFSCCSGNNPKSTNLSKYCHARLKSKRSPLSCCQRSGWDLRGESHARGQQQQYAFKIQRFCSSCQVCGKTVTARHATVV